MPPEGGTSGCTPATASCGRIGWPVPRDCGWLEDAGDLALLFIPVGAKPCTEAAERPVGRGDCTLSRGGPKLLGTGPPAAAAK